MDQAATPTGGAEVSARADTSAPAETRSPTERLKAFFTAEERPEREPQAAPNESVEGDEAPTTVKPAKAGEAEPTEDAPTEQERVELSTIDELAEALADQGYDLDRIMDLEAKVKIDGKEGKARLRDLIKSHQLEGHLNQKLMTHAEERKAFELERTRLATEQANKLLQMDAGLQTLARQLEGEVGQVDWQSLRANPSEFNAAYVAYEQRFTEMNRIAGVIAQEKQQAQEAAQREAQAYLAEQKKLLQAKVPEWGSDERRAKDFADMVPVLNKAYGFTKEELEQIGDHRTVIAMRDLAKYHQLMATKPAVLNKVNAAPKLLKPGSSQNRIPDALAAHQKARLQLKKTGSVADAAAALKRFM